jgi:hypothetical protein
MNVKAGEDDSALMKSLRYFAGSVLHPHDTFRLLMKERGIMVGFILTALKWVLCEFYVYYLYSTDQVLFAQPWLNIPAESFRFYELFYYIPFGFILWILMAGLAQTLAGALGGTGSFENCLNIMGLVVFTPFVFIDGVDALYIIINRGDWSFIFNTVTRSLYVLWSAALLSIGLKVTHKLSSARATSVSVLSSALSVLVNLIFIR